MTIIVTGAAGWFGQAFLDLLAAEGVSDVRAVVGSPADVPVVLDVLPTARVHVADVTVASQVAEAFEGLQQCRVVHAAGVIHPRQVSEFEAVNVGGTRNVLEAALDAGLTRFVHLSSNSTIGTNPGPDEVFRDSEPFDPYLGYGASKMRAEVLVGQVLGEAGVSGIVLRPPWFYGRFQPERQARFIETVRSGKFPLVGDGGNRRSMVDVDRLAHAAWLATNSDLSGVRSYWIADRDPYTMNEILDAVRTAAWEEGLTVKPGAMRLPAVAGRVAHRVDAFLQSRGRYQQEIHVAGELDKNIACSVAGAQRDLGFEPADSLVEGLRRSIRWGRANGQDL
jgi:nucleoside-diphosphate-sugar epimerase